jgi:hypothetical protein
MNRNLVLALAVLFTSTGTSRAGFIATFKQNGANVVATGSGTIDLTGLFLFGHTNELPGVHAELGYAWLGDWPSGGANPGQSVYVGSGAISGPKSFGVGGLFDASAATGDLIGVLGTTVVGAALVLPSGYVSDARLSNSTTWNNTTISDMGLTPGTYAWTWGSGPTADSFVVKIDAVPEPSSSILLVLSTGAIGIGASIRRRRAVDSGSMAEQRLGPDADCLGSDRNLAAHRDVGVPPLQRSLPVKFIISTIASMNAGRS